MKRYLGVFLVVLFLVGCAGGGSVIKTSESAKSVKALSVPVRTAQGDKLPVMDEFYEATAIIVPQGTVAQYIYGDNIAGYFEGHTHTYKKGVGYMMVKSPVYGDFASYSGYNLNNRKQAALAKIYPYGIRHYYSENDWDEMVMFSRQYALSLSVHSDKADILGILPILNLMGRSTVVEDMGDVVAFSPVRNVGKQDYPVYLAIASDVPFIYAEGDDDQNPELKKVIKHNKTLSRPMFFTKDEAKDFTIILAFGFSKDEAIQKAKKLAQEKYTKIQKQKVYDFLTKSFLWTDNLLYNSALTWAKLTSYFMLSDEYGRGIWAGLPWFKDNWGRDTFIALPGTLIVSGEFEDSKAVMTNFSTFQNLGNLKIEVSYKNTAAKERAKAYLKENFGSKISYRDDKIYCTASPDYIKQMDSLQKDLDKMKNAVGDITVTYSLEINKEYGRIPNRVAGIDNIIYNTTDGTPWFIREIYEYLQYTGDIAFAKEIYPVIKVALFGAISNFVDNNGFLTHDDADTWMDARINGGAPWSARGNRANDIQVLWFNALNVAIYLAKLNNDEKNASEWQAISDKLKENYLQLFWDEENSIMADRVRADNSPDFKIRPNQLMLISVPLLERFIPNEIEAMVVKNAASELLYPYGIASLSQDDPYFHPYHDNQPNYHKDAAYHNGTVWGWNAGPTISALIRYGYSELAYAFTTNLSYQIMDMGCRGSMSEVMDALPDNKGQIKLTGTYAQAWSTAEFSRNGYQDFGGFRPNLLNDEIMLIPAIPDAWKSYVSGFAFGMSNAQFLVNFKRNGGKMEFTVSYRNHPKDLKLVFVPTVQKTKFRVEIPMKPNAEVKIVVNTAENSLSINGNSAELGDVYLESYEGVIGELNFQKPELKPTVKSIYEKDYLKKIIESGQFK